MSLIDLYHVRLSAQLHITVSRLDFLGAGNPLRQFRSQGIAIYNIDIQPLGLKQNTLAVDAILCIRKSRLGSRELAAGSCQCRKINTLCDRHILSGTDICRTAPEIIETNLRSIQSTLRLISILLRLCTFPQRLKFCIVLLYH